MWRDRTRIEVEASLWGHLHEELARRGGQLRESGAFLLGSRKGRSKCRILEPVFYDDLDPGSCRYGHIQLAGSRYGHLWEVCRTKQLEVVADVHTHPGRAFQSEIDQENPMIPSPGHIALIFPWFATRPELIAAVGIYRYLGAGAWRALSKPGQTPRALVLTQSETP